MKKKIVISLLVLSTILSGCRKETPKVEESVVESETTHAEENPDFIINPSGKEDRMYTNVEMSDGVKVKIVQLSGMLLLSGTSADANVKEGFLGTNDLITELPSDGYKGIYVQYKEGNDIYGSYEDSSEDLNTEALETTYGFTSDNVIKTAYNGKLVYIESKDDPDIGRCVVVYQDVGSAKFLEISIVDENSSYTVQELVNLFIIAEREHSYDEVDSDLENNEVLDILDTK